MLKILLYVTGALTALHGLIHLMGFVAYWPLATLPELPYKTMLAGRWEVGAVGMRIYAVLWLTAMIGFLIATAGLLGRHTWWPPVMISALVLSTLLVVLDWAPAFRGAIINAVIIALLGLLYLSKGALARWL